MNVSIDWDTAERIGVNYIKESYITLLETMEGYDSSSQLPRQKSQWQQDIPTVISFHEILRYLLPEADANEFINSQSTPYIR
jgi:hypothetical protein